MAIRAPFYISSEAALVELRQAADEGKDVTYLQQEAEKLQCCPREDINRMARTIAFYDEVSRLPVSEDYSYVEPDDLAKIRIQRPLEVPILNAYEFDEDRAYDKIYGAWLGRCVGCLLGKPVEFWKRDRILGFAKETGNYPLKNYMSSDVGEELRKKYQIVDYSPFKMYGSRNLGWLNTIEEMPIDDDTSYTVLGLKILEEYGKDFDSENVALSWLESLPALCAYTAERVAYRNLTEGYLPPMSGSRLNPYREWIGAQLRADMYGYISPGDPEKAAEYAWRDGRVTHVRNGIYGEMFVAAMLAAAAVTADMELIVRAGLAQIPERSRLAEGIRTILNWKQEGISWEQAIDRMHEMYCEEIQHDNIHVIPNAMIVGIALLFGDSDFEKTISISVLASFDTDCNGATVGSVIGMVLGAKALPEKWVRPLHDGLNTFVSGFNHAKISDLASRTVAILKQN